MTPKIWVDFQKRDWDKVFLTTAGTKKDLERQGLELAEGMQIFLYQDDPDEHGRDGFLYAKAVVHWEERKTRWFAVVESIKHTVASFDKIPFE
jgi:hypothetical protein